MTRGVRLTRFEEALEPLPERGDGFRLRVEATNPNGMPAEIFGHKLNLLDPHTGLQGLEFCFVCSPEDLLTYPTGEPSPTQTPPYFRLDTFDIICGSREQAQEIWELVDAAVATLKAALDRKDVLRVIEVVDIGTPAEDEVSAASETSVSLG